VVLTGDRRRGVAHRGAVPVTADTTKETAMTESTDNYTSAVRDLAHALAEVWWVCDNSHDPDEGLSTGGNLPEALSYALGLAAVTLGLDRDDNAARADGERAQTLAAEGLVCHRPGSWEADHVRALTFPPDLIGHP
jgi:hypothetical protein